MPVGIWHRRMLVGRPGLQKDRKEAIGPLLVENGPRPKADRCRDLPRFEGIRADGE